MYVRIWNHLTRDQSILCAKLLLTSVAFIIFDPLYTQMYLKVVDKVSSDSRLIDIVREFYSSHVNSTLTSRFT